MRSNTGRRVISKTIRFGYDDPPNSTVAKKSLKKPKLGEKLIGGKFIAVRASDETFFIARLIKDVTLPSVTEMTDDATDKLCRICWYTNSSENEYLYKKEFNDTVRISSILMEVKMTRVASNDEWQLSEECALSIKNHLELSNRAAQGETVVFDICEDVLIESDVANESDKSDGALAVPAKKRRPAASRKKRSEKDGSVALKHSKKEKSKVEKKVRQSKRSACKWSLAPRDSLDVLQKCPFFDSTGRAEPFFVSVENFSKLALVAVQQRDTSRLERLIKDTARVHSVFMARSPEMPQDALTFALLDNNLSAMRLLLQERKHPTPDRVNLPSMIIEHRSTGTYNKRSLGLSRILKVNLARGSREGNNALTVEAPVNRADKKQLLDCLEYGVDVNTITFFLTQVGNNKKEWLKDQVYVALRWGNAELAAWLIEDMLAPGHDDGGFGRLHLSVLKALEVSDLPVFRTTSINKKSYRNQNITPLHCAACNPNASIMEKLLNLCPNYNVSDKSGWRPIHYAAACRGTGPLQLLLKLGVLTNEVSSDGRTPLHVACATGRADNVELLLNWSASSAAKLVSGSKPLKRKAASMQRQDTVLLSEDMNVDAKVEDEEEVDVALVRFGLGGINRATNSHYYPLHLAAERGHLDVVHKLLRHVGKQVWQLQLDCVTSTSSNKLTPLMLAASRGHLDVVRCLIEAGAQVEMLDRLKRSALMHAVRNGHTSLASYLLRLGSNPNHQDSSGNSLLHYAAAYGWLPLVTLLLRMGADVNANNQWQTTPLGIAFMKGHSGIVRHLLRHAKVSVDWRDETGRSLLMMACAARLEQGLEQQIAYLLHDMAADATLCDAAKNDALHILAANSVLTGTRDADVCPTAESVAQTIATLLLKSGCGAARSNEDGMTPLDLALVSGNLKLAQLLHEHAGALGEFAIDTSTTLHKMMKLSAQIDFVPVLRLLAQSALNLERLRSMAVCRDEDGLTPFFSACVQICSSLLSEAGTDADRTRISQLGLGLLTFLVVDLKSDVLVVFNAKSGRADRESLTSSEQKKKPTHHSQLYSASKVPTCWRKSPVEGDSPLYFLVQLSLYDDAALLRCVLKLLPKTDAFAHHVNRLLYHGRCLLHEAVLHNMEAAVSLFLQRGASPNIPSTCLLDHGETPIFGAVRCVSAACAQILLDCGAELETRSTVTKNSVLHLAACYQSRGTVEQSVLELLLTRDAAADEKRRMLLSCNARGRTPLHLAVNMNTGDSNSNTEAEEALIRFGAKLDAHDCRGRLPLHYAFVKMGQWRLAEQQVAERVAIDPINLATVLCPRDTIELDTQDNWGSRPLHAAVLAGASVSLMYLIELGHVVDAVRDDGNTPLSLAVATRRLDCCMALLQLGARFDVDVVLQPKCAVLQGLEWTPQRYLPRCTTPRRCALLRVVLEHDWQGVAFILVNKILKLQQSQAAQISALVEQSIVAQKYHFSLSLLRRTHAALHLDLRSQLEHTNSRGQSLLHVLTDKVAHNQNDIQLIKRIADLFVTHNVILKLDDHGFLPVHYAALRRHYALLEYFIDEAYFDTISTKDKKGRSLLTMFLWNSSTFADTSTATFKALLCKLHATQVLKEAVAPLPSPSPLWQLSGLPLPRNDYFTDATSVTTFLLVPPLIAAVRRHDLVLARTLLLDHAADVNEVDSRGLSALAHAIVMNSEVMVRFLLDHSYDPKSRKADVQRTRSKTTFTLFGEENAAAAVAAESDENDDDEEREELEEQNAPAVQETDAVELEFMKGYEPTVRTSLIDLNHRDKTGCSMLELVLLPIPEHNITYDNARILALLLDAGACAPSNLLEQALLRRAHKCALLLQMKQQKPLTLLKMPVAVLNQVLLPAPPPKLPNEWDVAQDAARHRQKLETDAEDQMGTAAERYQAVPDPLSCSTAPNCELVMDERVTHHFDALLNKVDVTAGPWGLYNFYKLQLLKHKAKSLYFLFTRWGRIGDTGQYQCTPFQELEGARNEFDKLFHSKTGQRWLQSAGGQLPHERLARKYSPVALDRIATPARTVPLRVSLHCDGVAISDAVVLAPATLDMLADLLTVDTVSAALARSACDHQRLVFGRIRRDSVRRAADLLFNDIAPLAAQIRKLLQNPHAMDVSDVSSKCSKLATLSSEYFQLIPQPNFAFDAIKPLLEESDVSAQCDLMTSLFQLQWTQQVVLGAAHRRKHLHPLEYAYRACGVALEPLAEERLETQILLQYVRAGQQQFNLLVDSIFQISDQQSTSTATQESIENRLLWHGTSPGNILSILRHGLLVTPPGVTRCQAFGPGIYLADTLAKSINYCVASSTKYHYALLCQLNMDDARIQWHGQNWKDDDDDSNGSLPPAVTVVKGLRGPVSDGDVQLQDGCTVPLGRVDTIDAPNDPKKNYAFTRRSRPYFTEYVVYDETRIRLRYLLRFKLNQDEADEADEDSELDAKDSDGDSDIY